MGASTAIPTVQVCVSGVENFAAGPAARCTSLPFPWRTSLVDQYLTLADLFSRQQHGPSIVLNTVEPTFAFALSVAGAGLFETHSSFFDEMSRIKREFAAEHLGSAKLGQDELLASVQVRSDISAGTRVMCG